MWRNVSNTTVGLSFHVFSVAGMNQIGHTESTAYVEDKSGPLQWFVYRALRRGPGGVSGPSHKIKAFV